MKLYLFLFIIWSDLLFVRADETNLVYPIDDGHLFVIPWATNSFVSNPATNGKPPAEPIFKKLPNGDALLIFPEKFNTNLTPFSQNSALASTMIMDSNKVEAAKAMRECLPAEDFPEGNWGKVQAGMQMSLRFDKQVYKDGEPIVAILLLRNVTNQPVQHSALAAGYGYADGPVEFEVAKSDGKSISQNLCVTGNLTGMPSEFAQDVAGQTEIKLMERLDKRFNLSNGTYFVQANIQVGDLVSKPIFKLLEDGRTIKMTWQSSNPQDIKTVRSAKVEITINN